MKYLLTGGGTGGHIYPALAIADEIRRRQEDAQFLYVGMRGKLESWVVPGRGYALQFVRSRAFPRSSSPLKLLVFAAVLGLGVLKALFILLRFRPHLIVSTGGYVGAPVMFAYGLLAKVGLSKARVFVYEPNAFPGRLNKATGRFAHRIGVAFEQAGRWFNMKRVAVVGYPVRREFLQVERLAARKRLGIEPGRQVLLAFGGSSGSRVINEAVVEALPLLRQRRDLVVLHITGRYNGPEYRAVEDTLRHLSRMGIGEESGDWYRRFDYLENIQEAYAAADLILCRGGAGTLTEIGVCGVPALIAPLATAAEDHQALNARQLEELGAAQVVYQEAHWRSGQVYSRIPGERLADRVLSLLENPRQLATMAAAARAVPRRNSLELIYEEVEALVEGRRPPRLSLEFPRREGGVPGDPNALLRHVRQRLERAGGIDQLDPRELAYLRYQADRLLCAEGWYEVPLGRRNVGIKLVGLLNYEERLPLMLQILTDRTQVSALRRAFGGDYLHAGILRRNVIQFPLQGLKRTDIEVEEALLQALGSDPYFEVRAAAARSLGELFAPGPNLQANLEKALEDRIACVVVQAIRALGRLAEDPRVLPRLRKFYQHADWQFRQEVVSALRDLLSREVIGAADLEQDLESILATSPNFKPEFPLKENLRVLAEQLQHLTLAAREKKDETDRRGRA